MTKQTAKKHRRQAQTTPPEPTALDDSSNRPLVDHAKALYLRLVAAVNAKVEAGEVNTTTLREMAGVMRAAATLDGEDRAREKMRLTFARNLQPSVVVHYLAGLSDGEFERVVSEAGRRREGGPANGEPRTAPHRSGLA